MKLHEVLSVISGGTKLVIYADCINVFSGKMADVTKEKWNKDIGTFLNEEVIRINIKNDSITIAV